MPRMADCHPDRPHLAKGMCNNCYRKANYHKYGTGAQKNYYARNRDKVKAKSEIYRKENRERIRETQRVKRLEYEYNLTQPEYEAKLTEQNNVCPICDRTPTLRKGRKLLFVVDHNHTTNKVRSLLCDSCNLAIGHLEEDIDRALKLIEYLKYWKTKHEDNN